MYKKLILIDLDGVLNTYDGKYDEDYIPPLKDGAKEFAAQLSEKYDLKLFTVRNPALAQQWLEENGLTKFFSGVTNIKEPAYLMIDDRAVRFCGEYSKTIEDVNNFSVWNKNRLC